MNWQNLFGYSGTADWILLTAFHSLWISLIAFLILRTRKLRAPAVRSTWCTFTLIVLLALPLITWLIPQIDVSMGQPSPEASAGIILQPISPKCPSLIICCMQERRCPNPA